MSSLLNQAVELAQAGQRDQARQLLWQYLQTSPDNEVAWLWLASVAVDQPEYVRALNEVLRINPANARAQQLLAEFQQQYGSVPGASTPPIAHMGPQQAISVGPSSEPSSPPPSPPPTPSYQPPPAQPQQQQQQYGYAPSYGTPESGPQQRVIERERIVEREKKRGCLGCLPRGCGCLGCGGCGQSCLVTLVLLIVLPAVICGLLSYANFSLGPLDLPASYLPDQFGTKTIMFDADQYEIKIEAPRSWYLVSDQNDMWVMWRDALDQVADFEDMDMSWENFEDSPNPIILETNPVSVHLNGIVVALTMEGEINENFTCDAVYARGNQFDSVTNYANNLCGYTNEAIEPYTGPNMIIDATPPNELHTYRFVVPVTSQLGLEWSVTIAEDMTSFYGSRIDRLIESVEVTQK